MCKSLFNVRTKQLGLAVELEYGDFFRRCRYITWNAKLRLFHDLSRCVLLFLTTVSNTGVYTNHDRANIELAQAGLLEPRPMAQM